MPENDTGGSARTPLEMLRGVTRHVASAESLEVVLQSITAGLVEQADATNSRIFLALTDDECPVCRAELGRLPFQIYHHHRASNAWIQIVDYCCWAVYRKWQHQDDRTYQRLRCRLEAPELDVFRLGDQTLYY